jgi:putative glycosyltransferase (TIGR04372 family)
MESTTNQGALASGARDRRRLRRRRVRRGLALLTFPAYWLAARLLRALGVRFLVNSTPDRIGHLIAEIDWFLKAGALGEIRAPRVPVWVIRRDRVANECILDYWSEHVRVLSSRRATRILAPLLAQRSVRVELGEAVIAVDETAKYPGTLARWGDRGPLLRLREEHRARGAAALRELGVPDRAWFVCVHAREGGYSPRDEYMHTYRNCEIDSYVPAMAAIVARGGWCLRMGDPTMKPLAPMPGVIDYALSDRKSDWMDVYLGASCRFFLGNTSGLCFVSTAFGVPSALAHLTPLAAAYPFGAFDVGIPKLVRSASGELARFPELLASPVSNYRFSEQYARGGLSLVDNTPEEIRELALELLDRIEGRAEYTDEDEARQAAFRSGFRAGHYTFGAGSRIGRDFLRRHAQLL